MSKKMSKDDDYGDISDSEEESDANVSDEDP